MGVTHFDSYYVQLARRALWFLELNDSNTDNSIEFNLNQDVIEPQTSIIKELDYDKLSPDSIWTSYMTKRGDYLSLIAYKEYNNANEWRRIYNWNRAEWEEKGIGPDRDNPNFIFPYKELDLKKPAENAIEWAYDYYIYIVKEGESLWTIAQNEYARGCRGMKLRCVTQN